MDDIQKIEDNHGQIAQNIAGNQVQNNYYITLKEELINNLMLVEINKKYLFLDKYYLIRLSYENFDIFNKDDEIIVTISKGMKNNTEVFIASYFDKYLKSEICYDGWGREGEGDYVLIHDSTESTKIIEAVKVYLFNLEHNYKSALEEDINNNIPPF